MVDLSQGRAHVPTRNAAYVAERDGWLAAMPAFLPSAGALTTKLVSLFPQNTDRPTHHAIIACFDPDTGAPTALLDGGYITATRTAAASALATKLLARPGSAIVSVIGTGVQGRAHARALSRLPGVELIQLAGRDPEKIRSLLDELSEGGIRAEAVTSVEEAVRSADVVCASTHADQPVVRRGWLQPGTHINSVGYNTAGAGEVDSDTVRDSVLVVESRAAVLAPPPSGAIEIQRAIDAGIIKPEHIHAELGELVAGDRPGRRDETQLTLYKSVGVAVQDAAAAALVLESARQRGVGLRIDL